MTVTFKCNFGTPLPLDLGERFGARVEIEALEFIGAAPVYWRLLGPGADDDYFGGLHSGHPASRGFHDLQVPVAGGTRGTPVAEAVLETLGIGDATVMVWLRDGTWSEAKRSQTVQIAGTQA